MPSRQATYEQYLSDLKNEENRPLLTEIAVTMVDRFKSVKHIVSRFAPVSFLLDFSTRKYLFVEETSFSLLGYSATSLMEKGHEDYISKWYPGEFEILNARIFPENFNMLKNVPLDQYPDYVFSYNYRVLNSSGKYVKLLQRCSYVPGATMGNPLGIIGVVFDISHFKTDNGIVHTIEKIIPGNGEYLTELILQRSYPVYESISETTFSKREIQVLEFLSKGLSSKQIADRLTLSVHTVNNHRKNMLRKMNCRNVAELLQQALKLGAF